MAIPIFIGSVTATPIVSPTPTRPGIGFVSVDVSEQKIFWGSCKHNKAKIIAKVQNPDEVFSVVIFVRVKALLKEDYTPWTTGDVMTKHGDGTFSYTLVGSEIEGPSQAALSGEQALRDIERTRRASEIRVSQPGQR